VHVGVVGDDDVYLCTKNGGGVDGPLNIVLPGMRP